MNNFIISDGVLKKYAGKNKYVEVPNGVTKIGYRAFYNSNVKNVVLPSSVKIIDGSAFEHCDNLSNINLSFVEEIGENAFSFTKKLKTLVLDGAIKRVKDSAFYGSNGIKRVYISKTVEEIGSDAFTACESLIDITVSSENKNYKSVAGCLYNKNLTTLIQYPLAKRQKTFKVLSTVENIFVRAFLKLKNVSRFTVEKGNKNYKAKNGNLYSKNLKTIIRYAVGKAEKVLTVDKFITNIGDFAYESANNLTSVTILNNVKSVSFGAFLECKNLKSVTITEGVKKIGKIAFAFCDSLEVGIIPNSVEYIESDAFEDSYATLKVVKYSYSHNYAEENDFDFEIV